MKSFWLTLILIPTAFAIGPILANNVYDSEPTKIVLMDRSGGETALAVEERFLLEQDRSTLTDLARYVRRYDLERANPQAPWAQFDRWYTEKDIADYRDAGGLASALSRINAIKEEGTPEFEADPADYEFVQPSPTLAQAQGDALQTAIDETIDPPEGEAVADYVILIGADYPQKPIVQLWSNDTPRSSFATTLQDVLTVDLRGRLLASQGVDPQTSSAIQSAQAAIAVTVPPPGDGVREALLVRSIVPLALSYILMVSLMLSGSWMLQSSVEERSNKLLESLLACVRAEQLMWGKLIGSVAVGLSMVFFWVICAGIVVFAVQGTVADLIRPALEPISSPWTILAIIYFFVAGYIAVSIMFLAIGSMSDSMSEAQGYLMPVMFGILLPVTFMLQAILADSSGPLLQVLTWMPPWIPFTVLGRLGTGIEVWELIGAGLVLAGFIVFEFVYLGRLFRASLLATGQKPGIKVMLERLRG